MGFPSSTPLNIRKNARKNGICTNKHRSEHVWAHTRSPLMIVKKTLELLNLHLSSTPKKHETLPFTNTPVTPRI